MEINKDITLPKNNFNKIVSIKKQIVLCDTFNIDMKHTIGWLHRYNGKYKKTAPFTIDVDGVIHQHFNPKYQSEFFKDLELNNNSIVILLENGGWLEKNEEKNMFISWLGHIYNKKEICIRTWRGYNYWVKYTDKQMESVVTLVNELCEQFFIPKITMTHNTKSSFLENFSGVLFKSNLDKECFDINPSFDFEYFSNNIK